MGRIRRRRWRKKRNKRRSRKRRRGGGRTRRLGTRKTMTGRKRRIMRLRSSVGQGEEELV
jgi:hypothetical protein